MPAPRPDRVRLVITVYRKAGMSLEEFQAYWRDEHSKCFQSIPIVKKNLLNYEQAHGNTGALQMMTDAGWPHMDCDGMAIFEASSYQKIFEVFMDDDYKKIVVPDEEKFLDKSKSLAFPADVISVFDDPT